MRHQRIGLALAIAVAAALAPTAPRAVEVAAGTWKLTVDGNVNADYIYSSCESDPVTITGGLACGKGSNGERDSSSVSNGLLPAALVIGASTTQNGFDVGATFGLYPGISTNDGGSPNLQAGGSHTALGGKHIGIRSRRIFLQWRRGD